MGMVNLILIVSQGSKAAQYRPQAQPYYCLLRQVESIRSLATRGDADETNELYVPALVAVGIAFRKPEEAD